MTGNLTIKSVEVVEHGITIEVAGENVNLNELSAEKGQQPVVPVR